MPAVEDTAAWWRHWSERCLLAQGAWRDVVLRSLITLKALTYAPTGGIVAAADDLAARAPRRRAQLGLPLLLAARRDAHAGRADGRRLHRGGRRLARLAAARGRRRARADADHVRRPRASAGSPSSSSTGCRATRARSRCASATPRPSSSSSTSTASSGRAARGAAPPGSRPTPHAWDAPARAARLPRGRLAPARRGHLGGARPAAALHPLEGDGVGGVRPRGQAASRSSGSTGPVERWSAAATEIHREVLRRGLRPRAPHVHPVLRLEGARRRAAA